MTAPTRSARPNRAATRGRSDSTARRRSDTALERRRTARRTAATVTAPVEAPPVEPQRQQPGRARSAAAQRAYARRAHREGRPAERTPRAGRDEHRTEDRTAGRASFVILIITLLAVGVAGTLWLSTQAIADSYQLDNAKQEADQLAERADQLQRDVTKAESASALAERARAMGMVPAGDPARLVVKPNGRVVVVGEPTRAEKPKPPAKHKPADDPATNKPAGRAENKPAGQQADRAPAGGNAQGNG
jgi:hypothetical protein